MCDNCTPEGPVQNSMAEPHGDTDGILLLRFLDSRTVEGYRRAEPTLRGRDKHQDLVSASSKWVSLYISQWHPHTRDRRMRLRGFQAGRLWVSRGEGGCDLRWKKGQLPADASEIRQDFSLLGSRRPLRSRVFPQASVSSDKVVDEASTAGFTL